MKTLEISALRSDFAVLCEIGRHPDGGWSRLAYGADDCRAHDWLLAAGREAGLVARYDAVGNAIVRLDGDDRPALLVGSHLDTVHRGGVYDGAIGVLAGLEVARRLIRKSHRGRPMEVIAFRDEEGRFGPFTGSRAMMGKLQIDTLGKARAADGTLLVDAMRTAGFPPEHVGAAVRDSRQLHGYLELHIEQGPVLEAAGVSLGIVSAIVGQGRLSYRFSGCSDHAGTTPMHLRRDAFAAAARFADRFRDLILATDRDSLRGTIGTITLQPNQANVVPGEARLSLEIRDIDGAVVDRTLREVTAIAERAAADMMCSVTHRVIYRDDPVPLDAKLQEALRRSAHHHGCEPITLPSGANHDAGILGRVLPAAMLFVPSREGRSHCPEEFTDWTHIALACDVLETAINDLLQ